MVTIDFQELSDPILLVHCLQLVKFPLFPDDGTVFPFFPNGKYRYIWLIRYIIQPWNLWSLVSPRQLLIGLWIFCWAACMALSGKNHAASDS